jgi:hypothetical protein
MGMRFGIFVTCDGDWGSGSEIALYSPMAPAHIRGTSQAVCAKVNQKADQLSLAANSPSL